MVYFLDTLPSCLEQLQAYFFLTHVTLSRNWEGCCSYKDELDTICRPSCIWWASRRCAFLFFLCFSFSIIPFWHVFHSFITFLHGEQASFSRTWRWTSATLGDCYCKWKEAITVFWRILWVQKLLNKRAFRCNSGSAAWSAARTIVTSFVISYNKNALAPPRVFLTTFSISWEEACPENLQVRCHFMFNLT